MIKILAIYFLCCQISLPTAASNQSTDYQNFQSNASQDCSPKWTLPLVKIGNKFYYVSTFHKASWYKAYQHCRFHGLQLATITSPEQNEALTKYLLDIEPKEHFWISGTDCGSEGKFFWMSTGESVQYVDWWPGQPDNYKGPTGETENCLCVSNPHGNELRWDDCLCSVNFYFVCELSQ